VDVDGYREKRAVQLTAMAESFALQAVSSGQPVFLPPMSASERRVVHLALQDRPDVYSESEGEGSDRRLVIKPKV
jgi:spoIIIJ-associated protein